MARSKRKKAKAKSRRRDQSGSVDRIPASGTQTVQPSQKSEVGRNASRLGNNKRVPRERQPPRSAAVSIKVNTDTLSYAEAIRKARNGVSLSDLGIKESRIRYAANGSVLVEIPGAEGGNKADILKEKLAGVFGDQAVVTRPVVKGDLRLSGFDDSISSAEVAEVVAEASACNYRDVKVGQIRMLSNGLCTVWLQCPLAAAIKVAELGKLRIGWTIARIELLKARAIRCFKCWKQGHLRNNCKSTVDRTRTCYRCGIEGHPAKTC